MKIVNIVIENFKSINTPISILTENFNCIVGKNDIGKSTILQALDIFLNDKNPISEHKNIYSNSNDISIELEFKIDEGTEIVIDGVIPTTFKDEELLDEKGTLVLKKTWDINSKTPKLTWEIKRKIYLKDDFIFLKEPALLKLCKDLNIETIKANSEEYNNAEKRKKLRDLYAVNSYEYEYKYASLPTTASSRERILIDVIKALIPSFEYFKADTSLSESDSSIQRYFRDKALNTLRDIGVSTIEIEDKIRNKVEESLSKITTLLTRH